MPPPCFLHSTPSGCPHGPHCPFSHAAPASFEFTPTLAPAAPSRRPKSRGNPAPRRNVSNTIPPGAGVFSVNAGGGAPLQTGVAALNPASPDTSFNPPLQTGVATLHPASPNTASNPPLQTGVAVLNTASPPTHPQREHPTPQPSAGTWQWVNAAIPGAGEEQEQDDDDNGAETVHLEQPLFARQPDGSLGFAYKPVRK